MTATARPESPSAVTRPVKAAEPRFRTPDVTEIGLSQVSVIQRWDRPSFFVVCQALARPQQPDRRQKTIVCPTWFPAPIPHQLGQSIFLNAWKISGDFRSSEIRLGFSFRVALAIHKKGAAFAAPPLPPNSAKLTSRRRLQPSSARRSSSSCSPAWHAFWSWSRPASPCSRCWACCRRRADWSARRK